MSASRGLLVEAFRAALVDAAEEFSAGAGNSDWPLGDIERVARALERSRTLLSRLEELAGDVGCKS